MKTILIIMAIVCVVLVVLYWRAFRSFLHPAEDGNNIEIKEK